MKKTSNENTFELLTGENKVLLSAPHAYDHKRPSLSSGIKQYEPWTDTITKKVASEVNCFAIMQRRSTDYDPNYNKEKSNPYKKEVRKIIKNNSIKYFIDIHGLSESHHSDILIYYPLRYTKSRKLGDAFSKYLDKGDLKGISTLHYNFVPGFQESLTEFVTKEFKIPGIQIEIARYIRESSELREFLINNITDFLLKYSI